MNRRDFVGAVAASAGLASSGAYVAPAHARMRRPQVRGAADKVVVTAVEIHIVKVNARGNWVLVRTRTNQGVTGVGDASHGGSDAEKVKYLTQFARMLTGRSVHDIEGFRLAAEPTIFAGGGTAAAICMSALEMSLWDIKGKLAGVPAFDLFGGQLNRRIRNYANINRSTEDRTPAGFARGAARAVQAGFDAVKLAPFDSIPTPPPDAARKAELIDLGVACATAVRDAVGSKVAVLVDVHSRVTLAEGTALVRRMEPLDLFWIEEVVPAKPSLANLAQINRIARMPTAGGESLYGVRGFLPYIAAGAVDILMPDVKYCGGMLELKKIAALAEAAGMRIAPHGPASPIGNLAAAHVCAGIPNFEILEFSYGEVPWRAEIVDPPEQISGGYITVSDRPGLGVDLNDRTVDAHRVGSAVTIGRD